MSGKVKIILVTGGSSGLGKAIYDRLAAAGHVVYGTSRGASLEPFGDGLRTIQMNVNDAESVSNAVDMIIRQEGRIDVVVNNAGIGILGPAEDTPPEAAAQAFDTNVLGAHRVCRAVLPHMRSARQGLIINITSLAAEFGLQYRPFYSATKAALERYSEALAIEVRPLGIDVVTVQPGDFRSNIAASRLVPEKINDAYRISYDKALGILNEAMDHSPTPDRIAERIERIIEMSTPDARYRIAKGMEKLGVLLKRILPGRMFQHMLRKHYE